MDLYAKRARAQTRRHFLKDSQAGLGAIALAALLGRAGEAPAGRGTRRATRWPPGRRTSRPRPSTSSTCTCPASPPQLDLFDYKPELVEHHLQPCPDESC